MEMIRCPIHSDPIINPSRVSFLEVFHHLRLEREELLTKRAKNCEVRRPTSVQVLRMNVLCEIIFRREGPCEAQVAREGSNVEMSPKIINSMKVCTDLASKLLQPTFCV